MLRYVSEDLWLTMSKEKYLLYSQFQNIITARDD